MKKGWNITTLDKLCEKVFAGGDVPKNNLSKTLNNKFFIPIFANGEKNKGLYGYTDIIKVSEPSITVSARGTIGYSEIRNEPFFPVVRLIVLTPNLDIVNINYLKYVVEGMDFVNSGSSIPQLTVPMIKKYEACIPPLAEQEAIVAVLDKAFAAIDQAKANLEQNIANAKELFQSKLNQIFSQKGEGWVEKSIEEIADLKYGITLKSQQEGDLRYVRITDIDNNGEITKENEKYVAESSDTSDYLLKTNDLVMARTGATYAKTLLFKSKEPSVYASYLIKISFTANIQNELYWYFTKTFSYWSQANALATGAAQPHFNGGALKQMLFSYPIQKEEQSNIILLARKLSAKYSKLIQVYQTKLTSLDELKKSILQKAFTGELT